MTDFGDLYSTRSTNVLIVNLDHYTAWLKKNAPGLTPNNSSNYCRIEKKFAPFVGQITLRIVLKNHTRAHIILETTHERRFFSRIPISS